MRLIRAGDCRRMAWKNGLGETVEIAVFPEASPLDGFDWRITVAADGPFSRFPGIDRTLSVLSGAGLDLTIDGASHRLTPTSAPLAFPADVETRAELLGGPVTDLNVMTRRGRFTHAVRRLVLDGAERVERGQGVAVLHCVEGSASLSAGSDEARLGAGDSVMAEGGTLALDGRALIFLVTLRPA